MRDKWKEPILKNTEDQFAWTMAYDTGCGGESFSSRTRVWAEVAFFENAKKWIDIVSMVFDLTSRKKI